VGKIEAHTPTFTHLQKAQERITGPTGLSRLNRCMLDVESQWRVITDNLMGDLKLRTDITEAW
jgi:hypothetical protein